MHVEPISIVVRENLASADPYYRGPHKSTDPRIDEKITPIDPAKAARDLGRVDFEHGGTRDGRFDQLPR